MPNNTEENKQSIIIHMHTNVGDAITPQTPKTPKKPVEDKYAEYTYNSGVGGSLWCPNVS